MSRAIDLAHEAQEIFDHADSRGRELTREELKTVDTLLRRAEQHAETEDTVRELERQFGYGGSGLSLTDPNARFAGGGLGTQFVSSKGYKSLAGADAHRPQTTGWSTGPVEVQYKSGVLLESGQGAGLVPTPQVTPGVVSKLFELPTVQDLFAQDVASTSSVRYIVEGTATSGAAGVAEGGAKPASDFAYSTTDAAVKKVATSIVLSDELFDDAPQLQSYLNGRLSFFVRAELDRQCLRGTADGNELTGIINSSPNLYGKGATDDNAACLARAIANTAGSALLMPDAVILHPVNYLATRLLRDSTGGTTGGYLGGGPFSNYYSGGAVTPNGLFGQSLWGLPVILDSNIGLGTALVGAFKSAATLYRRGALTVEASNSGYIGGKDLFTSDQISLRAEQRAALVTFRPTAFTVVSGLTS